ncbi:MAG: hypothetical protein NC920_01955, partial [Candidatus Omnitrophica bacterium]|nr:hypothetical protein [Candidatus Omnitrophota bacterium]
MKEVIMEDKNSHLQNRGQKNNNLRRCLLADASVFIGFTTVPLGEEVDFIKKIEKFFENYRNDLCQYLFPNNSDEEKKREVNRWFYRPSMYYIFGAFDLAVLSLLEDFEFPVQTFAPCDPHFPSEEDKPPVSFAHRIVVGPAPRWNREEIKNRNFYKRKILNLAQETFLKEDPPPFIGICQIEVNTSFLVGGGTTFLRCLIEAIESFFHLQFREKKKDESSHLIILESYSWHELTLLLFSDSLSKIADFIFKIRNMDLATMEFLLRRTQFRNEKKEEDAEKSDSYRRDWDELMNFPNIYELVLKKKLDKKENISRITEICFDDNFPTNIPEDYRKTPPSGTHVIFNTTTNLGFSAKLLLDVLNVLNEENPLEEKYKKAKEKLEGIAKKKSDEETIPLYLIRRWTAKAGHDIEAAQLVSRDSNYIPTAGRSDFISPCQINSSNEANLVFSPYTSWKLVARVIGQLLEINYHRVASRCSSESPSGPSSEPSSGILTAHSTVAVNIIKITQDKKSTPEGHSSANEFRKSLAYPKIKIDYFYKQLRSLRISKVLTEAALNTIALYNDGIQDNFTFSTFLELRPYIERIVEFIKNSPPGSNTENILSKLIEKFEYAWCNRFYGGWRLGEVTDFNIEFKGGIQQILSGFHSAYQLISWALNGDHRTLALVTGESKIMVEQGALHLSFFDIFKPSFFASRVGHEASEQILELPPESFPGNRNDLHKIQGWSYAWYNYQEREAEEREWRLSALTGELYLRIHSSIKKGGIDKIKTICRLLNEITKLYEELNTELEKRDSTRRKTGIPDFGRVRLETTIENFKPIYEVMENSLKALRGEENLPYEKENAVKRLYQKMSENIDFKERWIGTLDQRLRLVYDRWPLVERACKDLERPIIFDQIFADICNYIIFYGEEKELYIYRYLGNFVITPANWVDSERIDATALCEALLRLFLTVGANPHKQSEKGFWDKVLEEVHKYWKEILKYYKEDDLKELEENRKKENLISYICNIAKEMRNDWFSQWCDSAYKIASVPIGFLRCAEARVNFEEWLRSSNSPEKLEGELPPEEYDKYAFLVCGDLNRAYEKALG